MTMPDFLVIGVAKSGTTSLYNYLNQHPQIAMSPVKEPNFFNFGEPDQPPPVGFVPPVKVVQTLAEYHSLFADLPYPGLYGEASPSNFDARACERINRYLPSAKFIGILRQPVERAYSAFAMHLRDGNETEPDFRRAYFQSIRRGMEKNRLTYALRNAGYYVERLQDWLSRFPHRQLHIGLYDDLKADPAGYMRQLYAFLGVDETFTPNIAVVHNRGNSVRSLWFNRLIRQDVAAKRWLRSRLPRPFAKKIGASLRRINSAPLPPLDPQLRRELTLPQRDDILRLQDLISRDLTHWLAG